MPQRKVINGCNVKMPTGDFQQERRLQRQRADHQYKIREPGAKRRKQIDKAKSQSKYRNDEHMLHKDTYYIINMTETR